MQDEGGLRAAGVQLIEGPLLNSKRRGCGKDYVYPFALQIDLPYGGLHDPVAPVRHQHDDLADPVMVHGGDQVLDHGRQSGGAKPEAAAEVLMFPRAAYRERRQQVAVAEFLGHPGGERLRGQIVRGDGQVIAVLLDGPNRQQRDLRPGLLDLVERVLRGDHVAYSFWGRFGAVAGLRLWRARGTYSGPRGKIPLLDRAAESPRFVGLRRRR